ncbi:MAG: hypothetical protein JST84_26520 [Acidobacteria bacterium]|nr:hypothetical protein [Acidobacteriota bacterium]
MSSRDRIVRYIFGQQTEAEQQQTELDYFADPELLSEINAVCDEFIENYLQDNLSPQIRAQFTQRLHAMPFLCERVETMRALMDRANLVPSVMLSVALKKRWWASKIGEELRAFWTLPRVVTGMGLLVVVGGIIWFTLKKEVATPLPSLVQAQVPPSATNSPESRVTASISPAIATVSPAPTSAATTYPFPLRRSPVIASLLLSAAVTRGSSALPTLAFSPQKGLVRLQLELSENRQQLYRAELLTAAQQRLKVWTRLTPVRYERDLAVDLLVPAELLKEESYIVRLRGAGQNTADFRFRVERR